MAMLQDYSHRSSNSNYARKTSTESSRRSNTQASAYAVDATTMALTGFHFSTCGAGGAGTLRARICSIARTKSTDSAITGSWV